MYEIIIVSGVHLGEGGICVHYMKQKIWKYCII